MLSKSEIQEIDRQTLDYLTDLVNQRDSSEVRAAVVRVTRELLDSGEDAALMDWQQILRDAGYNDYFQSVLDEQQALADYGTEIWRADPSTDTLSKLNALQSIQMDDYGELGRRFAEDLKRAVEAEINDGVPRDDLIVAVSHESAIYGARMNAARNTALHGYSNALNVQKYLDAGFEKFVYAGNDAEREFCKQRLGQLYTYQEILDMDNGQIGPVWIYRGGYNCVHRWKGWDESWSND